MGQHSCSQFVLSLMVKYSLQEIFQLIVDIFRGLDDVDSPFFSSRVNILETVAKVRSCVVMLDLECDDLITEMFRIFFTTARLTSHLDIIRSSIRNLRSRGIPEENLITTFWNTKIPRMCL